MRVLIVEDEYALADVLKATMEHENYTVDIASDGEDGLEQGLTGIYDIILLDVMLPKMNGFSVLEKLRKEKITSHVVMLTAKSELDDKVKGLDCGADDYMTKPFQTRELLARLRAVSRRKGELSDDRVLRFADIELDTKSMELTNAKTGASIKLGAKEFQLLEYLLRNSSQILTREQIAEKIWGFDSDAEYNNVEVYISFLRKKINFIGAACRIKAVRGVGYIMEEAS